MYRAFYLWNTCIVTAFSLTPNPLSKGTGSTGLETGFKPVLLHLGFIFPEDEEDEDVKDDLIKFCGTKSYLGSINFEQETADVEEVLT